MLRPERNQVVNNSLNPFYILLVKIQTHVKYPIYCELNYEYAIFSGKLRRTQIMNYTLKGGAIAGNALGTIAVLYSLTHCLISLTGIKYISQSIIIIIFLHP